MIVNIHEAKTNLSKLIAFLENGEDVIIAKAGTPVAKLISYKPTKKREPNLLKGKVEFFENFDNSNKEIEELFEGLVDE